MKIRNGFVSNSSSSSFILVTTQKVHDDVVAKMGKVEQTIIKALVKEEVITIKKGLGGPALMVLTTWSDAGGNDNFSDIIADANEVPDNEEFDGYEVVDKYINAVKKSGKYFDHEFGDGG